MEDFFNVWEDVVDFLELGCPVFAVVQHTHIRQLIKEAKEF